MSELDVECHKDDSAIQAFEYKLCMQTNFVKAKVNIKSCLDQLEAFENEDEKVNFNLLIDIAAEAKQYAEEAQDFTLVA